MVYITEDLVRKRSEHNECEIFSLEELSLHQCDIEKIQHIDRWCRNLKILYLQSNLISKIEHVNGLKCLEYLNLALNSIERVENLERCESLNKLDLTANFIGEITSFHTLRNNYNLRILYLTGNPCCEYTEYRAWMIHTLPQLTTLDGHEITKSERIAAAQNIVSINSHIQQDQNVYLEKRRRQKKAHEEKMSTLYSEVDEDIEVIEDRFKNELTEYTPESRRETHIQLNKMRNRHKQSGGDEETTVNTRKYRLEDECGNRRNMNAPKLGFTLNDDRGCLTLDLAVYKHMATEMLDVDVQPTYVTVMVKDKPFQLVFHEEVRPDDSTVKRSQVTGHLLVTMPKVKEEIIEKKLSGQTAQNKVLIGKTTMKKNECEINRTETVVDTEEYPDLPDLIY